MIGSFPRLAFPVGGLVRWSFPGWWVAERVVYVVVPEVRRVYMTAGGRIWLVRLEDRLMEVEA